MDHFDQRLILYIKGSFARGLSAEQIKATLLLHGWREEAVDTALPEIQKEILADAVAPTVKRVSHFKLLFGLWLRPLLFAVFGFIFFGTYAYFYLGKFSLLGASMTIAGTASICIGASFALSGLSYYLTPFRKMLGYKRYLGLLGYFLALTYAVMLLFVDPAKYYLGFFTNLGSANFILGLTAMAILTVMTVISNNFFMKKMGIVKFHAILRFGYLAYFLLVLRAILVEGASWSIWLGTLEGLPPPRLLVTIFATCVILLRLILEISLRSAKKKSSALSASAAAAAPA